MKVRLPQQFLPSLTRLELSHPYLSPAVTAGGNVSSCLPPCGSLFSYFLVSSRGLLVVIQLFMQQVFRDMSEFLSCMTAL